MSTPIVSHIFGLKSRSKQFQPTQHRTSQAIDNIQESNRGATEVHLPEAMTKANFGSSAPTGQASTKEQNNPSQPPPCKASTTTHQAARPRHPKTGPNPPATRLPHTHAPHPQPQATHPRHPKAYVPGWRVLIDHLILQDPKTPPLGTTASRLHMHTHRVPRFGYGQHMGTRPTFAVEATAQGPERGRWDLLAQGRGLFLKQTTHVHPPSSSL